jgi:hypothetical protein
MTDRWQGTDYRGRPTIGIDADRLPGSFDMGDATRFVLGELDYCDGCMALVAPFEGDDYCPECVEAELMADEVTK